MLRTHGNQADLSSGGATVLPPTILTDSWKVSALSLSPRPSYRCSSGRPSRLCGSECLDQLLHALDHEGWQSVFGSLRARHPL